MTVLTLGTSQPIVYSIGITMTKLIAIALVIGAALGVAKYAKSSNLTSYETSVPTPAPTLTPTPMPFATLTIPYLQQYQYQSQMGELTPLSTTLEYSAYLTNYTSDNLTINALLTRPNGDMPATGWPAIVFIHGYIPPSQYQTQEKYVEYVNYLASNGFVVFKIDLRGHGQSQGEANGGYYSGDYVIDTLNAHRALQTLSFVNPEHIGLWGHSMAGNVIVRALAARPQIGTGVVWAGAVFTYQDLQEYGISDGSYRPPDTASRNQQRRQQLFDLYGRFSPDSPFWQQVAPISFLKDKPVKIQLHHAVDDEVVSIQFSRNLVEKLNQSQVTVDLREYPTGGHNISNPSFIPAMEQTVAFFQTHLR
jgi:uncharacterized protein